MPSPLLLLDPSEYLSANDFPAPRAVVISRALRENVKTRDGSKEEFAFLYVMKRGQPATNAIDAKTGKRIGEYERPMKIGFCLTQMLMLLLDKDDFDKWTGRTIVVFATTCKFGLKTEPCLRIQAPRELHEAVFDMLKNKGVSRQTYMIDVPREAMPPKAAPPKVEQPSPSSGVTAARLEAGGFKPADAESTAQ